MTTGHDDDVQRSLGRIEGALKAIDAKLDIVRVDLGDHKADDQRNFSSLRVDMRRQFDENDRARNQHLNEQDVKLDELKQESDRAKGAGWVILGLLGALATFVGGAVISALSGVIKFH